MSEKNLEKLRIFDAYVKKSGNSLQITIPKQVCEILGIEEGDIVNTQLRIAKKSEEER